MKPPPLRHTAHSIRPVTNKKSGPFGPLFLRIYATSMIRSAGCTARTGSGRSRASDRSQRCCCW
ncbi:hypothetical protein BRO06_08060 [Xanthomonas oryzae pv. oryzae]|nr:hypothetical protein BRO06_08060 [Xanthomonas oryzae pv. oryzae]